MRTQPPAHSEKNVNSRRAITAEWQSHKQAERSEGELGTQMLVMMLPFQWASILSVLTHGFLYTKP